MINDVFNILLPQTCLAFFILVQMLMALFVSNKSNNLARIISALGIFITIVLLSTVQTEPQYFGLRGAYMSDSYTLLFHFVILLCGFFVVLLSKNLMSKDQNNGYSFQALLLTAIFGAINIVSANDFLTLFISLELLTFPTYFLISFNKGYYSKEATFKYLITNAVSTGVFLLGVSYLYGITLTLNISEIYEIIIVKPHSPLFALSGILIILGLISKLALFPFANWILDVYKGCETSVLAFLSTIPKLALFGILCRLIVFPLGRTFELSMVIVFISILTAFWANTYAIREKNIKVILACSSAANAAYIMLAAGLVSLYNLSTVIFYLICYVIMNISVFAFLNIAELNNIGFKLDDYKGFLQNNIGLVICYIVSVLGLAGFPITSGFVAKVYLFSGIAHSGLIFIPFLVILLMLTVVAVYYYLKILLPLFENIDKSTVLQSFYSQKIVLVITSIVTVIIGIYPEKLIELCRFIAYNI